MWITDEDQNYFQFIKMMQSILLATFALSAAAAPSAGFLQETSNSTICDTVKQYSGYYKLTTGAK